MRQQRMYSFGSIQSQASDYPLIQVLHTDHRNKWQWRSADALHIQCKVQPTTRIRLGLAKEVILRKSTREEGFSLGSAVHKESSCLFITICLHWY